MRNTNYDEISHNSKPQYTKLFLSLKAATKTEKRIIWHLSYNNIYIAGLKNNRPKYHNRFIRALTSLYRISGGLRAEANSSPLLPPLNLIFIFIQIVKNIIWVRSKVESGTRIRLEIQHIGYSNGSAYLEE